VYEHRRMNARAVEKGIRGKRLQGPTHSSERMLVGIRQAAGRSAL
jgi:hypothetical protein